MRTSNVTPAPVARLEVLREAAEPDEVTHFEGARVSAVRELVIRNSGDEQLVLGPSRVTGLGFESSSAELCLGEASPPTAACQPGAWQLAMTVGLAPGETVALPLTVRLGNTNANAAGLKEWQVSIPSNDPSGPALSTLRVRPVTLPPCNFTVAPQPPLDFGSLPAGESSSLGFKVCNLAPPSATADTCLVSSARVTGDGRAVFRVDRSAAVRVAAGRCEPVLVEARAPRPGPSAAVVELVISNPTLPIISVPVRLTAH